MLVDAGLHRQEKLFFKTITKLVPEETDGKVGGNTHGEKKQG